MAIFTLCNLSSSAPAALTNAVADLVLNLGPAAGAAPARPMTRPILVAIPGRDELTGLAGIYHSDELLADWRLVVRGDSLFARAGLGREFRLNPTGRDRFSASGTQMTFLRAGDQVSGLTLDNRGLRNFTLTRTGSLP